MESIARAKIQAANSAEYLKKIENFRAQTEGLGTAVMVFNIKILKALDNRANPIFEELALARAERRFPNLLEKKLEFFMQLPNAVRALAAASLSGSEMAADGLYIRGLLKERDEMEFNRN